MADSTISIEQLKNLRPLGKFEQFSSARHHLGFFNNVGISVTYNYASQETVDLQEAIFQALSDVIRRHPILSCITVNENSTSPYFASLQKINLEDAVEFVPRKKIATADSGKDVQLDEMLQEQHNTPFKYRYGELPFWRFVVIFDPDNGDFSFIGSFIFHHSLGDGASGIIFHRHFLQALNCAVVPGFNRTVKPSILKLLPNLELLHPLSIPPPKTATPQAALWSGGKITLPVTTKFQSVAISKTTTASFLFACRAHETTVTATLLTIVATSIFQNLPDKFTDLTAGIPVNIRHWLPSIITNESFGVWIDSCSVEYSRSALQSFSWDEARRTKHNIVKYLKSEGREINVGRFKKFPDMREVFSSKVGTERDSSFDISNVGAMGNCGEGRWGLEERFSVVVLLRVDVCCR